MLKCLIEFELYNDVHVLFCNDKHTAFLAVSSIFKRINEMYTIGRKNEQYGDKDLLYDLHNYGANIDTREIFLHNYYSSDENENPGVEYKMSNNFLKKHKSFRNKITVNL